MTNKTNTTLLEQFKKSNIKIVDSSKIDTPDTNA